MNLNELTRLAPALLRSPVSRLLSSQPGMGKTQFASGLADIMSEMHGEPCGFARIFAPTANPIDIMGYTKLMEREFDGVTYPVSEHTMPGWFRCTDETGHDGLGVPITHRYKRGILIIEEYGQGEVECKKMFANLFLERQIGPWRLPDGWRVWGTTNAANHRSGVTKDFDHAINRRNLILITPDLQSWKDWAFRRQLHPDFITFGDQNSSILFSELPEKQGPFCTPRSLELAEIDLRAMSSDGVSLPTDSAAVEITSGTIGVAAAAQLMTTLRLGLEMPRYEEIVKNPSNVKVPSKPDAQMLVCYRLAAQVSKDDAAPVIEYMQRMPKEFAITFARAATNRDKSLITTKAFHNWCAANASLVVVLQSVK